MCYYYVKDWLSRIHFIFNLLLVTILQTLGFFFLFFLCLPLLVLRKLTVHGFQEPQQNMEVMVRTVHIFVKKMIFFC